MKPTTKVNNVNGSPDLKNLDFMCGVKDRMAAQAWGEKHGYAIVYFWPRRNRAYAEKLTARIDLVMRMVAAVEAL